MPSFMDLIFSSFRWYRRRVGGTWWLVETHEHPAAQYWTNKRPTVDNVYSSIRRIEK